MTALFKSAALLLLATAAMAYQGGNTKVPRAPGGAGRALRRGVPGARPRAAGPRLVNPANPVARLYRASPEERERALEKLPPAQQERFRQNLRWFDSLPAARQEIVLRRVDRFASLPPEQQRAFGEYLRALNRLPPGRRAAVAAALRRLEVLPDAERTATLESDTFKNRFTAEEQKLIAGLSEVLLPE